MLNIYENSFYHAIYNNKNSDHLIITLTSRTSVKEDIFFGENFFNKFPHDTIFIRSIENDWYAGSEFKKCLQEIEKIISKKNYKNIIAYGTSMGGYGAICMTSVIKVTHLILAAPIWNIHADYERRWKSDAIRLSKQLSLRDLNETTVYEPDILTPRINNMPKIAYLIHDQHGVDKRQVAEVKKHIPCLEIFVPYSGHFPLSSLSRSRILSKTLKKIVENSIKSEGHDSLEQINWLIHSVRKDNTKYLAVLLRRLRRKPKLFDIAIQYALNRHPGDYLISIALMRSHLQRKSPQKALKILRELEKSRPNTIKKPKIAMPFLNEYIAQTGGIYNIEDIAQAIKDKLDRTMEDNANKNLQQVELYNLLVHHLNRHSPNGLPRDGEIT
ncbi:hypothetical protein [Paracoccus sp. R86501]|uniref:hypothetical protein n=1 Tax=Paracoccus sp. R86501 TaxID=3101711 RepID=UPI00366B733D